MGVEQLKEEEEDKRDKNGPHERVWTFGFSFEVGGKKYEGPFTNKILSNDEKMRRGYLEAKMRQGEAWEAFSPEDRMHHEMVAHLLVSLTDRPDWAKDLGALDDLNLIAALYGKVGEHEATFRKPRKDQKGSSS